MFDFVLGFIYYRKKRRRRKKPYL